LQIKVNNRKLKEVDNFKHLGIVSTGDGYCTRETKMRIAIAKEAFNRKISLLTSKLNIKLRKKLVRCNVSSNDFYGSEAWTQRKLEREYFETYEMWCWRRTGKIKWAEKVTNELVLERIGERVLL